MPFEPQLSISETINNERLCTIFKCGPQGGMRKSNTTNSLVIISNHVDSIYDDRWSDEVLHYTGMGQKGNQSLAFMQNKTLSESETNGVQVFLFEVFQPQQYTFRGQVKLASAPYPESQPDEEKKDRQVWMFPLRLVENIQAEPIQSITLDKNYQRKLKQARKLTDDEIRQRAENSHEQAGKRQVVATQYERSPWVSEYAKRRAKGKCELCSDQAPFQSNNGEPYLETHHVEWLAIGGSDTIYNTVALCPNCHRKVHVVNDPIDKQKLIVLDKKWI